MLLDPAASILLLEAAHAARQAEDEHREVAESKLPFPMVFEMDDEPPVALTPEGAPA